MSDPISHPWEYDYTSWRGSSLFAIEDFSSELDFWWHISWPQNLAQNFDKLFFFKK